ncbi:MAG: cation-translocating P-type ATPase, partial [Deltaproteobacteria bacterium]|nr:cation-translocating P-type ATPase [Deltaproteobacteria bacterium]
MKSEKIRFIVSGMHCASCVKAVENAAKATNGVEGAFVNFASGILTVETSDGFSEAALISAVGKAGYSLKRFDAATPEEFLAEKERDRKELSRKLAVAVIFSIPLFVVSMSGAGFHFSGWL